MPNWEHINRAENPDVIRWKSWIEIGQLIPISEEDDLGTCCECGKKNMWLRHLTIVNGYAPLPGTGWGDERHTNMRLDGALIVLCDDCFGKETLDRFEIIYGNPKDKKRVPHETIKERGQVFDEQSSAGKELIWDIPHGKEA